MGQAHSPKGAPLIPELRGQFAEFLNRGSLERLRILSLPTCVSFSTVTHISRPTVFLGSMASVTYGLMAPITPHSLPAYLPLAISDAPLDQSRGQPSLLRPFQASRLLQRYTSSAGIFACSPSATPFSLALGPANPGRICLPQETLGYRRMRFSLILSLLVPA